MEDENLSHHEPTGSEPEDETPGSPRGSLCADVTLEDGELTIASSSGSVGLARNPFVIERFLAEFHPTISRPKAMLPSKSA